MLEEDRGAGIERPYMSLNVSDVLRRTGNRLNALTDNSHNEGACNLYSKLVDGHRVFFVGDVYMGMHDNVIAPYLFDLLEERKEYGRDGIRYEGLVHSHPNCKGHKAEELSTADLITGLISGNVYAATPSGNIRNASRSQISNNILDLLDASQIEELVLEIAASMKGKNISSFYPIFDAAISKRLDPYNKPMVTDLINTERKPKYGCVAYTAEDMINMFLKKVTERDDKP